MAEDDIFDVETFTKNVISGLDTPKELFVDIPLGAVQAGYNVASGDVPLPKSISDIGSTLKGLTKDSIPNVPGPFAEAEEFLLGLENSAGAGSFEEIAGTLTGSVASGYGTIKVLDQIKEKSPSLFKKLRKAYPFSVGQFYVAMKALPDGPGKINKFLNMMKGTLPQGFNIFKDKGKSTVLKKVLPNLLKLGTAGGALSMVFDAKGLNEGEDEYMALVNQLYKDGLIEKDEDGNIVRTEKAILLQQQEENAKNEEARKIIEENTANYAIGGDVELSDITTEQPGYISEEKLESMFEDADLKPTQGEQMPEVQMAGLFGKAPLWGVAAVDKAKMLLQQFTKNEKKNMDNVASKLGTEADVNTTIDDIVDVDITAEGTAVGVPKQKKTIIDSPETNESVFYSGLEARLMDPNTPESFTSVDAFFDFINRKGVGKAEIEDNALMDYVAVAKKNNLPLSTEDMLTIIRKAPLRKIDNVTYGDARYGGTNRAKYDGYQESGALPGTYREDVMYLPSKDIPLDPDALPPGGAAHDFGEKYVIGWSRLTDRKATLPVEKTAQGIEEAVDPAMIRTLKRNQTKLKNQLKGLEASAYEKIRRAVDGDLTPIDEMNARMITETIDSRMAFLEELDTPLANQIRQFRSKIQDDSVKLKDMEATTKGQQVIVTFADEIQSDVLQNAKRFEEKLHKALGDLLDKTPAERRSGISAARYDSELRDVNPEVAEFYVQNKTVFRPLFKSDVEMQQFIKEFQENKKVFEDLASAGTRPDKELVTKANEAMAKEKKMLEELQTAISENAMKQLYPNVPFKNRSEWGEALVKRDLAKAADLLYQQKIPDAAEWYAVSPAKFVKNRYNQQGGTSTPIDQRTKNMKGIGTEEFYGGPDSVDSKGKHYTSVLEKALKRAAKENNSEFKIIKVDGMGDVFAVKITPEMLLPHKTHRKKGGLVYTPEIIDIFEAA
jgi:hypothetical protein